jgi:hypothetical protein
MSIEHLIKWVKEFLRPAKPPYEDEVRGEAGPVFRPIMRKVIGYGEEVKR